MILMSSYSFDLLPNSLHAISYHASVIDVIDISLCILVFLTLLSVIIAVLLTHPEKVHPSLLQEVKPLERKACQAKMEM